MLKRLAKKLIYENRWIRLWEDTVQFPTGESGVYGYVDRVHEGAMIIPVTDDGRFAVLREWRYPIKDWTWCWPVGGGEEGHE